MGNNSGPGRTQGQQGGNPNQRPQSPNTAAQGQGFTQQQRPKSPQQNEHGGNTPNNGPRR